MKLFTKPNCEKCDDLKKLLTDKGVSFEIKDTASPEVISELRPLLQEKGISSPMLPILEFDDGALITNDMGIYKNLKQKAIL